MENEPALPPPAGPTVTPDLNQPASPAPPYPAPPYPAPAHPAQPYPAQPYPAQPYPAQPYPAQPYPAQAHPAQAHPAQAYPAPAYPAPAPPFWPPPAAAPTTKRSGALIAAVVVFALVLAVCLGTASYGVIHLKQAGPPTASPGVRDATSRRPGLTLPSQDSSAPAVDGATSGPQASPYPVAEIDDLDKVCEDQYFPQSPKYTGKAPHPLAIMIKGRLDMQTRINTPVYTPDFSGKTARDKAWNSRLVPKTVQLVACVDLVASGQKLKTCKFDDPKPDSIPLKTGYYELTLYEAATHRRLFAKRIAGDDRACPTMTLIGSDHTLYTEITDRYYLHLLKPFVEK